MLALSLLLLSGISLRYRMIIAVCLLVDIMGILVSGVRLYVVLMPVEILLWILFTARSLRELARNVGLTAIGAVIMYGGFLGAQSLSEGLISQRYADTLRDPVNRLQKDRGQNFTYLPWFITTFPLGVGYQRDVGGGVNKDPQAGEVRANRETVFNSTAADMGVPGLILVVILLIGIPLTGRRILRSLQTPDLIIRGAMLLSLLIGYALMGLGGPSLQAADFYWFYAGILFTMPIIERNAGKDVPVAVKKAI
jgi:hypothetical protein